MAPWLSRNDGTRRPVRWAMISAQIDTAVSSGVRAPMSRPIGEWSRSSSSALGRRRPRRGAAMRLSCVRPAAHHADVADPRGERTDDRRNVELGVVRQHAHRVAGSEGVAALVEHRCRPRDEHLVGHREAAAGGEHLAGVAHRDAVAEHLGDPSERGGEVDRPEDPHLRGRRMRLDEHAHGRLVEQVLRRGLSFRAVVADARRRGLQLGEGVAGRPPGRVRDDRASRSGSPPAPTRILAPTFGPSITVARATGCSVRSASANRSKMLIGHLGRCTALHGRTRRCLQ